MGHYSSLSSCSKNSHRPWQGKLFLIYELELEKGLATASILHKTVTK